MARHSSTPNYYPKNILMSHGSSTNLKKKSLTFYEGHKFEVGLKTTFRVESYSMKLTNLESIRSQVLRGAMQMSLPLRSTMEVKDVKGAMRVALSPRGIEG